MAATSAHLVEHLPHLAVPDGDLLGPSSDSDRARSLAAGFDDHLVKPLRLELLEQILERGNTTGN